MADWAAVRREFPSLERWTFLNTATFGQLPARGVEAMCRHLQHRQETACGDFLSWFDDHDRLREKLARLIHASAEDIAFVPNASSALAMLMAGLDWQDGDEILTLEGEFPNQIYAPAFMKKRGVAAREVAWERLAESVGPWTKLVAVSTVNYSTGFRTPIEELARVCRERGVTLYLDGTQSVGALEFDFQAIQPDMLAVNAYKWMLAPNGAAFMAVHPRLRARLDPLTVGWRSHHDWRNVDNLHQGAPEFKASAEKYEGGMLSSAVLYALEASVDLMLELGTRTIEERVLGLARECRKLFAEPLPHDDSAIVAAKVADASTLARALKEKGIQVSARHGFLRVSTHFYNDELDLERLNAAVKA